MAVKVLLGGSFRGSGSLPLLAPFALAYSCSFLLIPFLPACSLCIIHLLMSFTPFCALQLCLYLSCPLHLFAPFCVWFHPINPACALHTVYACLCTLHLLAPTCAFCVCSIKFAPSHAYMHPLHLCLCFCANLHLLMPKTAHYCNILKTTVLLIFLVHWC